MDELAKNLPAIIGAAAQSNLGILALFAIALSGLAYVFFARASERARIGIFVLLFFGVSAFGAAIMQSRDTPDAKAGSRLPELSADFFVGRWQVDQAQGQASAGTIINYRANGRFDGTMTQFVGDAGQRAATSGQWDFEKLSTDSFLLKLEFDNSERWQGTFRVLDANRIHNIDANYVAVRVE